MRDGKFWRRPDARGRPPDPGCHPAARGLTAAAGILRYDRRVRVRDAEDDDWVEDEGPVFYDDEPGPDLGPDERDMDLIDGTWEERYYTGRVHQRDWSNVFLAIGLLVVLSLVLPAFMVLTR